MSLKRKFKEGDADVEIQNSSNKARGGFTVGPDNLPDGAYRRKLQRKKQNLIRDANIKKSYAKVKDRELSKNPAAFDAIYLTEAPKPSSQELHPERRAMLDGPKPTAPLDSTFTTKKDHRRRHPKANPFQKEAHLARQRIEQAKEKQKAIEYSQKQRQEKLMERDRYRKAMAKARTGGKNGQRKLGRESKILLEKVKMIMSE